MSERGTGPPFLGPHHLSRSCLFVVLCLPAPRKPAALAAPPWLGLACASWISPPKTSAKLKLQLMAVANEVHLGGRWTHLKTPDPHGRRPHACRLRAWPCPPAVRASLQTHPLCPVALAARPMHGHNSAAARWY